MTAGIYLITNTVTGDRCIGKSKNLENRIKSSQQQLAAGSHTNKRLQKDWQIYGSSSFEFRILEAVDVSDCHHKLDIAEKLERYEQWWFEELQPEYNILIPRCKIVIAGVYLITHTVTGHCYVGQTIDMVQRWQLHRKQMVEGTHPNRLIRELVRDYGVESFTFKVLEVYQGRDRNQHQLKWLESQWIQQLQPELNYHVGEWGRICRQQRWTEERRQRMSEQAKERWRRRRDES